MSRRKYEDLGDITLSEELDKRTEKAIELAEEQLSKVLKIRSQTMLGTSHSWSVTMRSLLSEFQKLNHRLYLISTNSNSLIPKNLRNRLDKECSNPDIDICYTLPRNFYSRFRKNSKKKMVIYNYETSHLPKMWASKIKYVDYVLPSSTFSKQVFLDADWPEDKCVVVPHGIHPEDFQNKTKHKLFTDKKFKFLNISIPHYRKNLDLLLDAYYSTFTNKDDVCLVLKTKIALPDRKLYRFEADVRSQIVNVQRKYASKINDLPQVEIIQDRLEDIVPLYNACDVLVSASSSEGFGLPLLEGLAAGNLVIAPGCTGQLDFLNDHNSLLVDVDEIEAGEKYQYWTPTKGAITYLPRKDSLCEAMWDAYQNKDDLLYGFQNETRITVNSFTWENAAKRILTLA